MGEDVLRGWAGRYLRVDLSTGDLESVETPREVLTSLLGGKGLGAYLLYREAPRGVDPLSPENPLVIAAGPLSGIFPGCGRFAVVTKSPLTGYFIDSHASGFLGAELKYAGFDAVLIKGRAERPVYLLVRGGGAEVRDARRLWGMDVYRAHDAVFEAHHGGPSVAVVGPAGENLVRYAVIHAERLHAAGRGGTGAVMGSKRLKAIAVMGSGSARPADLEETLEIYREVWRRTEGRRGAQNDGTTGAMVAADELGMLPTRNFQTTSFEHADRYDPSELRRYRVRDLACFACPRACVKYHRVGDVRSVIQYEGMAMLGSNLGLERSEDMMRLYERCNRLGLDVISAGSAMALAAECAERGLLRDEEFGDLRFGDAEGFLRLADAIAHRRGLGDLLAEGAARAAGELGAPELAVHVKGLDVPAWDPRGRLGLGLSYATADVGASHLRGWPDTREKPDRSAVDVVESMVRNRDRKAAADSLIVCSFLDLDERDYARMLRAATGVDFTPEEVLRVGWRIETLARLFNLREGLSPLEEDVLPPRLWEPVPRGPSRGMRAFVSEEDFLASRRLFYRLRGWDEEGRPTDEVLEALGLRELLGRQLPGER